MKKRFRSFTAVLMAVVMVGLMMSMGVVSVDAYSVPNEAEFLSKINYLRQVYPNGGTWSNVYYENGVAKAWQCHGYACKMMYEVFGVQYYNDGLYTKADYNMGTLNAGDLVRINGDGHSIFITKVTNDRVFFTDANADYRNGIRWDASYTLDELRSKFTYKVHVPGNSLKGNGQNIPYARPEIVRAYINYQQSGSYRVNVEVTNCESVSSVRVATWTKQDQTDLHWNTCNFNGGATYFIDLSRADYAANASNYCNDIYVYDTRGENVGYMRIGTIYSNPTIVRTYINYQKLESYRVNIEVTNIESISSVKVATWTQDQSDLHWNTCHFNGASTYFIDLSRSDFAANQNSYCNDVYVYGANGECVAYERIGTIYKKPSLEDVKISEVSKKGYRISAKLKSDFGISSAQFPTWTATNGQDDLVWHNASVVGNYVTCYIKASEHNNEKNGYITHLYVTDGIGQYVGFTGLVPYIDLTDDVCEIKSMTYQNNRYVLFNHYFTWTQAKEWCESQGGHLVTVSDEDEWNAVTSLLSEYGGILVWLGAENTSGNWRWVTGENMTFKEWAATQPDNSGGKENYLGTVNPKGFLDCYKWNDYNNGDSMGGFICEFENEKVIGDVNGDDIVDIFDATIIQKYAIEKVTLTEEQLSAADVNNDGFVDVLDAIDIQKFAVEKITEFKKKA